MFCKFCGGSVESSFQFCPSCGKNIEVASTASSNSWSPLINTAQKRRPPAFDGGKGESGDPTVTKKAKELPNYTSFAAQKSRERQTFFKTKSRQANNPTHVTINVGLLEYHDDSNLKPVRGSSLPLKINVQATYEELLDSALQKREAYDSSFSRDRGYVLAYPDTSIAKLVPGTTEDFTLIKYKEGLGKSYSRITLYLAPVTKKSDLRDRDDRKITNEVPEKENTEAECDVIITYDTDEQVARFLQEASEEMSLNSDDECSFLATDFL